MMGIQGGNKWYLELCHNQEPHDVVMYVPFRTDKGGKIAEILLSKNKEWFKPLIWASE